MKSPEISNPDSYFPMEQSSEFISQSLWEVGKHDEVASMQPTPILKWNY